MANPEAISDPNGQPAWLLNLGQGLHAAIGHAHLLHLLPDGRCQAVPRSPGYCRQVVVWQGHILPVMDIALRLSYEASAAEQPLLAIIAFQLSIDQPVKHGSLQLAEPPKRITVSNAQASELPDVWQPWHFLCHSCFEHPPQGAIPILNLPAVFATPKDNLGKPPTI